MAKHFNIEGTTANYTVAEGMTAALDLGKAFPGWSEFAQNVRDALVFSLKTALRNATAGKMDTPEAKAEAFKSVQKRCAALEAGTWAARREGGGGESRESVLARALAAVMDVETSAAVDFIDEQVAAQLEANGIDADADAESLSEEEKTKKAAISRAVRKAISEDPAIAIKMATIKAEDALKKAEAAEKENAGKTSKYAKA